MTAESAKSDTRRELSRPNCGYDLRQSLRSGNGSYTARCPECGHEADIWLIADGPQPNPLRQAVVIVVLAVASLAPVGVIRLIAVILGDASFAIDPWRGSGLTPEASLVVTGYLFGISYCALTRHDPGVRAVLAFVGMLLLSAINVLLLTIWYPEIL